MHDYASATNGAKVIKNLTSKNARHSGPLSIIKEKIFGLVDEVSNLIKDSPSQKYWSFSGPLGSVGIRFSRPVKIISFSLEYPQHFDKFDCTPKRVEIWGLLNGDAIHKILLNIKGPKRFNSTYNIKFFPSILLAEFDLKPDISKLMFPSDPQLLEWAVAFDTILVLIHSSLNRSHTCIHRFHAYGT